jgi:transcriptional regulator with XRE-family HTH domain
MTAATLDHETEGGPHPVDLFVGLRMRIRRKLIDLTQRDVAGRMGLTFQQIQKYECGANRLSASRLYELSKVLDVPVSYFFENSDPVIPWPAELALEINGRDLPSDLMNGILELITTYYGAPEPSLRKRLLELMSDGGENSAGSGYATSLRPTAPTGS